MREKSRQAKFLHFIKDICPDGTPSVWFNPVRMLVYSTKTVHQELIAPFYYVDGAIGLKGRVNGKVWLSGSGKVFTGTNRVTCKRSEKKYI